VGAGRGTRRSAWNEAPAKTVPPGFVDANLLTDAASVVAAVADAVAGERPCRVAVDSLTALCALFPPWDAVHALLDIARLPNVDSVITHAFSAALPPAVAAAAADAAAAVIELRPPPRLLADAGAVVLVETSVPKASGRVEVSSDGAARVEGFRLAAVDRPPPPPPPPPAAPTIGTMRMDLTPDELTARAAVVLPHEARGWRGRGGGGGPVVRYDRDSESDSLADSGEDPDDALDV